MTAIDDTPSAGQESIVIDWEAVGKDALATLIDVQRMETSDEVCEIVEMLRDGETPSRGDIERARRSIESYRSVVEMVLEDHLLEVDE